MATPTTFTVENIDAVQLGTALSTLLTVPANTNGIKITSIILVNDLTTAVTATLHFVPSGGSADDTNIVLKAKAIPTDGTPSIIKPDANLEASGLIRGLASVADKVTVHISYIEFD